MIAPTEKIRGPAESSFRGSLGVSSLTLANSVAGGGTRSPSAGPSSEAQHPSMSSRQDIAKCVVAILMYVSREAGPASLVRRDATAMRGPDALVAFPSFLQFQFRHPDICDFLISRVLRTYICIMRVSAYFFPRALCSLSVAVSTPIAAPKK